MKEKQQVFAVVRVENRERLAQVPDDEVATWIRVQKVLPTADEAVAEAARLNVLNGDKGCFYFAHTTRWFPRGLGGEPLDDE